MVRIGVDLKKRDFVWIGLVIVLLGVGFGIAQWDNAKSMFHDSADVKITIEGVDYSLQNASDLGLLGGGGVEIYDSGWISYSKGDMVTRQHGLSGVPDVVQLWFSNTNDGSGYVLIGSDIYSGGYDGVYFTDVDSTSITVHGDSGNPVAAFVKDDNTGQTYNSGYIKIKAFNFVSGRVSGGGGIASWANCEFVLAGAAGNCPDGKFMVAYDRVSCTNVIGASGGNCWAKCCNAVIS